MRYGVEFVHISGFAFLQFLVFWFIILFFGFLVRTLFGFGAPVSPGKLFFGPVKRTPCVCTSSLCFWHSVPGKPR